MGKGAKRDAHVFSGSDQVSTLHFAVRRHASQFPLAAVVLALINFYLRYAQGAEAAVKPWGVVLSLIVVGILLFTGWKGWEMVYQHYVAVLDAPGQTSSEPVTPHQGGESHRRAA